MTTVQIPRNRAQSKLRSRRKRGTRQPRERRIDDVSQNYQDPFAPTTQIVGAGLGALVGVAALGAVSNALDDGFDGGFGGGEDLYFEPRPDNIDRRNYNTGISDSTVSEDIYLVGDVEPQRRGRMEPGGDPFGFGDTAPPRPMRRERMPRQRDDYAYGSQQYYQNDPFGPTNQIIGAGLGAVVGLAALGAVTNVLGDGFGGEDQYFKNNSDKHRDNRNYKPDNYEYETDSSPEDIYLNDYGTVGPQALQNLNSVVDKYGRDGIRVEPGESKYDGVVDIMENNISASIYFEPDHNPGQVASIYDDGSVAYYNTEHGYFSGGNTEYESILAEGVETFKRDGDLSDGVMVGPSEQYRELREKYNPRFQTEQYGRFEDPDLRYRETYPDIKNINRTPLQDQYFQQGQNDNFNNTRMYSSEHNLSGNSVSEDIYLQTSGRPGPTAQRTLDSYYENRGGRPYEDFGDAFGTAALYARENFAVGNPVPMRDYEYTPMVFGDGSAVYVHDTPQGFSLDEGSYEFEEKLKEQIQNEEFDIHTSTGEFFESGYPQDYGIHLGPDNNGGDDMPTPPPDNPFDGTMTDTDRPRIYIDKDKSNYPEHMLGQDYDGVSYVKSSLRDDKYERSNGDVDDNVRKNIQNRMRDSDSDVLTSEIARNRLSRRMERSNNAEHATERARILGEAKSFMNTRRSRKDSSNEFDGYVINDYESNIRYDSDTEPSFYRNGVAARAMGRT